MSVRRLNKEVDARELQEWMAFDRLEPIGPVQANFRAALVAATIANVNRDRKKQPKPFTLDDFLLDFDGSKDAEQTWEQQLSIARVLQAALGGELTQDRPAASRRR